MKNIYLIYTLSWAATAAVLAGCGHKSDAKSELEDAANALAKTEPAQAAPATPQPAAPAQSVPAEVVAPTAAPPAQEVRQALASYKAGNLEDAVTRLQKLRASTVMTPEQRMAMQDAVAAVMGEIYGLAEKGDARAIQAVRQYEQMQTRPH